MIKNELKIYLKNIYTFNIYNFNFFLRFQISTILVPEIPKIKMASSGKMEDWKSLSIRF